MNTVKEQVEDVNTALAIDVEREWALMDAPYDSGPTKAELDEHLGQMEILYNVQ